MRTSIYLPKESWLEAGEGMRDCQVVRCIWNTRYGCLSLLLPIKLSCTCRSRDPSHALPFDPSCARIHSRLPAGLPRRGLACAPCSAIYLPISLSGSIARHRCCSPSGSTSITRCRLGRGTARTCVYSARLPRRRRDPSRGKSEGRDAPDLIYPSVRSAAIGAISNGIFWKYSDVDWKILQPIITAMFRIYLTTVDRAIVFNLPFAKRHLFYGTFANEYGRAKFRHFSW